MLCPALLHCCTSLKIYWFFCLHLYTLRSYFDYYCYYSVFFFSSYVMQFLSSTFYPYIYNYYQAVFSLHLILGYLWHSVCFLGTLSFFKQQYQVGFIFHFMFHFSIFYSCSQCLFFVFCTKGAWQIKFTSSSLLLCWVRYYFIFLTSNGCHIKYIMCRCSCDWAQIISVTMYCAYVKICISFSLLICVV